jgi:hypothetical protein
VISFEYLQQGKNSLTNVITMQNMPRSYSMIRLRQLADHIANDLALLSDYENAFRYEDDPRRRAKYNQEIERLRKSMSEYRQEYEKVKKEMSPDLSWASDNLAAQLQDMDDKLEKLLMSQLVIHTELQSMRQSLLARYSLGEQVIIGAISEQLDRAELVTVHAALEALEADRLSQVEMQRVLNSVQEVLAKLHQMNKSVPSQDKVIEAINEPTLDIKHKLKVTVPIVPLLLGYEGEIELGSKLNLETAWKQLLSRAQQR